MTRRRFAFWVGMLLFWLGERVHASLFDATANALMRWSENRPAALTRRMRWTPKENRTWRWYERQRLVDAEWTVAGVTRPVHKFTGELYSGSGGYLDNALVPVSVQRSALQLREKLSAGNTDAARQAAGGLPPSQWLRSLHADEIRFWLQTIAVPEVGVEGMTFWTHLTRDHSFSPDRIKGLTVPEQAKLHSAAHYGY